MKALGVTYHFLSKPLIEMAKCHLDPKKPSICYLAAAETASEDMLRRLSTEAMIFHGPDGGSFCARMKRGMLFLGGKLNSHRFFCSGDDDRSSRFCCVSQVHLHA